VAALAADTDFQGQIPVPVLTVHGIHDSVAFVELESFFHDTMVKGGSADRLVQTFTNDSDHSYQSDANYVAAMRSLVDWVDSGNKPSAASVTARCLALSEVFDPVKGCRFQPGFTPPPLSSRVPAR
jgi:hypothetical protein